MSEKVEQRVFEALAPVVATMEVDLVEVEWTGGLLKLVVDAEGGVSTDTLAKVNRLCYPLVEQQSLVSSAFSLEVTSPGLEKPLTKPEHFERAVGETISVRKVSAPKHLLGELVSANAFEIEVIPSEINGKETEAAEAMTIEMADISRSKIVFDWKAALSASNREKKNKKKRR